MVTKEDIMKLKDVLKEIGIDDGIRCRELTLDYKIAKDFFVHDSEEMKELGGGIVDSDVIMDYLSSEDINRIMELVRKKLEGASIETLQKLAGSSALSVFLMLTRLNYLVADDKMNDEGVGKDA